MTFNITKIMSHLLRCLGLSLCLAIGYAVVSGLYTNGNDAYSGERAFQLTDGFYKITTPLEVGRSPALTLKAGHVHFAVGKGAERGLVARLLPPEWTALFLSEKLKKIKLKDGDITLDLTRAKLKAAAADKKAEKSGMPPSGHPQFLSTALLNSRLSNLVLKNSKVTLLTDHSRPLTLFIKEGQFNVDLDDGELDGSGFIEIDEKVTAFQFSSEIVDLVEGQNNYQLDIQLTHPEFSGRFEGIASPQNGGQLKGDLSVNITSRSALSLLYTLPVSGEETDFVDSLAVDSEADDRATYESKTYESKTVDSDQPQSGKSTGKTAKSPIVQTPFKVSFNGALDWAGREGELTNAQFNLGGSPATGSLGLKLKAGVRQISGTLAFDELVLTPDTRVDNTSENASFSNEGLGRLVGHFMKTLYPLTRDFDADLRLSAKEIRFGSLLMEETGFSLFEKQGELILDLAQTRLFDGVARGHIKIDTNTPKPRWHTNVTLSDASIKSIEEMAGISRFIEGRGDLKIHLTSFGDKLDEIYQNMYGAVLFQMPKGGQIAVNLDNLTIEQTSKPTTEWQNFMQGKTAFTFLESTGHFAKGAMVTDFFTIKTSTDEFTGTGEVSLSGETIDWHIASWPLLAAKEKEASSENGLPSIPLLQVCSHITGAWSTPRFEKHNAMHLALLRRGCKARYRPAPLKSNNHNILPLEKAG
ncbi:MAG: hypothetical protein DHS20C08_01600 [Rhodomicrobium sp.]|nr:MAG: hypothetical protein DHS20C08_01600 [Rhodomicrobium sp.]